MKSSIGQSTDPFEMPIDRLGRNDFYSNLTHFKVSKKRSTVRVLMSGSHAVEQVRSVVHKTQIVLSTTWLCGLKVHGFSNAGMTIVGSSMGDTPEKADVEI